MRLGCHGDECVTGQEDDPVGTAVFAQGNGLAYGLAHDVDHCERLAGDLRPVVGYDRGPPIGRHDHLMWALARGQGRQRAATGQVDDRGGGWRLVGHDQRAADAGGLRGERNREDGKHGEQAHEQGFGYRTLSVDSTGHNPHASGDSCHPVPAPRAALPLAAGATA
ncbi:MAG: hypothetical protein IPK85_10525 [Gemmatimonadetes bacterium]|nr:hypothetical protein [Gemmatimonadota bacterium]